MTTLFIMLGTKVFATTGEINSREANLRKKPSDNSTILDIVYKGDEVEILEKEEKWYKVKAKTSLGKVTGYISADLIDIKEETEQPEEPKDEEDTNQVTSPDVTEETKPEITPEVNTSIVAT